jgi:type IV pilus assembly protein PilW
MSKTRHHSLVYQNGFGLVEVMVGMVIGLLATLVVLQVFSVFEGQKRTTTGTADAQTNGNVALFSIQRELEMAGYGLLPVTDSPLECTAPTFDTSDTGITTLSPVTITDGGTGKGASDTITIRYATSDTGGSFTQITAPIGTASDINGLKTATVYDNQSCHTNDVAIVIHDINTCALTTVGYVTAPPTDTDYTGITLKNTSNMGDGNQSYLACLGKWNEIQYSINPNYNPIDPNNSQAYLQRNATPADPTQAAPVVSDIVNIQAQYGISASVNSNQIVQWVDATGIWAASATTPTIANRNLIKAVRIAVVARNGLLEKTNVSSQCSSLVNANPTGVCAWDGSSAGTVIASPAPQIDLSNDPLWQQYRYRVYETIIPLRNVIWSKSTL